MVCVHRANAANLALGLLRGDCKYRPFQEECIKALLSDRDLLAVLPTGSGKSLVYQVTAMALRVEAPTKRCLVVTPLVSLQEDQMSSLNASPAGDAGKVASKLGDEEAGTVFVFATPERLRMLGRQGLADLRLSLIVVDEAHCIHSHGLAFREDYRELKVLREVHPCVPICALTATATDSMARDIASSLGLRGDAAHVRAAIDRPNLRLDLLSRGAGLPSDVIRLREVLLPGVSAGGRVIVYVRTRKDAEDCARLLADGGMSAAAYHAGLEASERASVQQGFVAGTVSCVAATVAFGMGVDVPCVRAVVHYGLPGSLEAYAQEIGRAGRDGMPSTCTLFWKPSDAAAQRVAGSGNLNPEVARSALKDVLDFAQARGCLRARLSLHFGDAASACGIRGGALCCFCREVDAPPAPGVFVDYSAEARQLLLTAQSLRAGAKKQVDHVARADAGHRGSAFWAWLHAELLAKGFLRSNEYGACLLTPSGREESGNVNWLFYLPEVSLGDQERGGPTAKRQRISAGPTGPPPSNLFEALRQYRMRVAAEKGRPAFTVFHDSVLKAIAAARPRDMETLMAVAGVGRSKLEEYGQGVLAVIESHTNSDSRLGLFMHN